MALRTPSRRLVIVAVLQVVLLAFAFWALATPLWVGQSMTQRMWIAFGACGVGILIGWLGAHWARAARPIVPEPPGLEVARRRFMARSRTICAILVAVPCAFVAPIVPELAEWPKWMAVLLGGAVGALVGAFYLGQFGAAQAWVAQMPRFSRPGGMKTDQS